MYENGKMRPVEIVPGMGDGEKRMMEGVNLITIQYKHFCKCYNVFPV
jgi:hypothetical protein